MPVSNMNNSISTGFSAVSTALQTRRDEANNISDPLIKAQQLMSLDMLELQTMQNMSDLFIKTLSTISDNGAKTAEDVVQKF
jgi:hypothetical protein